MSEWYHGGLESYFDRVENWYTNNKQLGIIDIDGLATPLYVKTHTIIEPYMKQNTKPSAFHSLPVFSDGVRTRLRPVFYTLKPSFIGNPEERNWHRVDISDDSDEIPLSTEASGEFFAPDNVLFIVGLEHLGPNGKKNEIDAPLLDVLWNGFERLLIEKFPTAHRIYTDSTCAPYEDKPYQAFLTTRNYEPYDNDFWIKRIDPIS